VLGLVFASFALTALAPAEDWAYAAFVLIQAAILCAALWTSALPFGRLLMPAVFVVAVIAALVQLSSDGSTTRGAVSLVEVAFLLGACAAIVAGVIDQGEVNTQSVLGALCIYVTLGMLFTVVYGVLAAWGSGAFFAQGGDADISTRLYFSFVTLATLGYGDYTPAGDLGRMLAVLEALIGQLYLVTVVALVVGHLGSQRQR
jgi:hypothetical protein